MKDHPARVIKSVDDSILRHMPVEMLGNELRPLFPLNVPGLSDFCADMDEDDVLAMVLENSRQEYLASYSKERAFEPSFGENQKGGGGGL